MAAERRPTVPNVIADRHRGDGPFEVRHGERGEAWRLAWREFMTLPMAVIAALLAISALAHAADRAQPGWLHPLGAFLTRYVFHDAGGTQGFLQTTAQTVITVTSIVFSLLIVAVQQTSQALSSQVFGQFLRRRTNQFYFGFFVGSGLSALLALVTTTAAFNPVFTASVVLLMSVVDVALLLVLLYTTINQMRPSVVLEAIHDHTVEARARQIRQLVARTRREPRLTGPPALVVSTATTGFVVGIEVDRIQRALAPARGPAEVVLLVSVGSAVVYGDPVAEVRAPAADVARIAGAVERGLRLERQRTIDDVDAGYGIEQLEDFGWTAISSAKHTPVEGRLAVTSLLDVLVRLAAEPGEDQPEPDAQVVYHDSLPGTLLRTFESLITVCAESHQHQTCAEILRGLAARLDRLAPDQRAAVRDLVLRMLPLMSELPPTRTLHGALRRMAGALERCGDAEAARLVGRACDQLGGQAPASAVGAGPRAGGGNGRR